jgi:protease-4
LQSVWNEYANEVARSRKMPVEVVMKIANDYSARTPESALQLKMVDQLAYLDEVHADIKRMMGMSEKQKIKFVSLKKYNRSSPEQQKYGSGKVAVIYAVGEIGGGDGDDESIGSDQLAEVIRKARTDSSIKAIVLRVNSPGGSALASDVIWREMTLAKKTKPVVVSMGDVAASGGYYIACAADTIVAQPNTITGSIGVFGLLFNTQKMFSNKLGITFDTVKTGKYADIGSITHPMSPAEKEIIQQQVEHIYDVFLSHVSEGRKMDKASIDSIGQGRVWSGTDAKALGLVDVLGGINTATDIAAHMAKLDHYRTVALPEQKEFFKKLMEDLSTGVGESYTKEKLGESYTYYKRIESLLKMQGIQARMPFDVDIY